MTTPARYARPLPMVTPENERYWQGARDHELWLRNCRAEDRTYFYPRDICPSCGSRDTEWKQVSGQATLYTYAIVHRAPGQLDPISTASRPASTVIPALLGELPVAPPSSLAGSRDCTRATSRLSRARSPIAAGPTITRVAGSGPCARAADRSRSRGA